jgi:hypothetical protein
MSFNGKEIPWWVVISVVVGLVVVLIVAIFGFHA